MRENVKTGCVVVTYNRLELLKLNISALEKQTYKLSKIYIVNNCSTDGTDRYLAEYNNNPLFEIITLDKNIGGAGGFATGIKKAVLDHCQWVWVMDDDTIPDEHALTRLMAATKLKQQTGFVCSKVIWTDGKPHAMNKANPIEQSEESFNSYSTPDIPAFLIESATFVSTLINADAILKVGLPIKEFFIWADDIEYTQRISQNGFCGFYVDNSIVLHHTAENYAPMIDTAPISVAWKFYYQARNLTYIKSRRKNRLSLFLSTINMYRSYMRLIRKRPRNERQILKRNIIKGCIDGLSFNPTIEFIQTESPKK